MMMSKHQGPSADTLALIIGYAILAGTVILIGGVTWLAQ